MDADNGNALTGYPEFAGADERGAASGKGDATVADGFRLSRRGFLASACCLAAAPVLTPFSFAAAPGDARLVTIILRGAMDGLDLLQPHGDPLFATLRPSLALTPDKGLLDLDGRFGLHPAASALLPLWQARELAFVQAVSTPYRDGRNHLVGQDVLESGGSDRRERNGWLNRTLATIPRTASRRAIDINTSMALILAGPNDVDLWSTQADTVPARDEIRLMERLYAGDEHFAETFAAAMRADADDVGPLAQLRSARIADTARLAGHLLARDYRIGSFSITGWDTHARQADEFADAAGNLALAITTLKDSIGAEAWSRTVVLAMTEFGRTVRENSDGGTDHGTAGTAILAGGAVDGGRIFGTWPGLAENQLYASRDLMPTGDLRELAAAMVHKQYGVSFGDLTGKVFPGLSVDAGSAYLKG